jgi:hypothetical protein
MTLGTRLQLEGEPDNIADVMTREIVPCRGRRDPTSQHCVRAPKAALHCRRAGTSRVAMGTPCFDRTIGTVIALFLP